jgi:hypothetical protein
MVGLLSLPDELLTHILNFGGHTTIVVCQQARTPYWQDTSGYKLTSSAAADMPSYKRPREEFNGFAIRGVLGGCRVGR